MNNLDLSTITTKELLEEVYKRFDCSVFSGVIIKSKTQTVIHKSYRGNLHVCSGLGIDLALSTILDFKNNCQEGGEI